ncbi:hypothetical protein I6F33_25045 [Bradyrhizobium sp. BRP20]|nr:hypothetical protein [Bradyrhizobium sp. BRP20]
MGEQGGGTVQVKVAFSAFRDGEVLQYLGLECGAEPFGLVPTAYADFAYE